jgi:acylphosphatase
LQRAKILAKGNVQGVGFRNFVYTLAKKYQLVGYTHNLKNGDVETIVEGDRSKIETIILAIQKGNTYSRVDEVVVEWNSPIGEFQDFTIRR